MTPTEFRKLLAALKMNQSGAAKFFEYDPRSIRRWLGGDLPIPASVAMLAGVMLYGKVSPWQARLYGGLPTIDADLARMAGRPAKDQGDAKKPKRRKERDRKGRGQDQG